MQTKTQSAINAYSKVDVEIGITSASPQKLVVLLYEGAIKSIAEAKLHLKQNDVAAKGKMISKAIAIIDEGLKLSLDEKAGGELAQNLKALYDYMCRRLLLANLKNEVEPLDEVSRLLGELKQAWEAIGKTPEQPQATLSKPTDKRDALSYGKA